MHSKRCKLLQVRIVSYLLVNSIISIGISWTRLDLSFPLLVACFVTVGDVLFRHPLTLQMMLRARHYTDIAIVSDAIHEPIAGKRLKYMGRDCKRQRCWVDINIGSVCVGSGSVTRLQQSIVSWVVCIGRKLLFVVAIIPISCWCVWSPTWSRCSHAVRNTSTVRQSRHTKWQTANWKINRLELWIIIKPTEHVWTIKWPPVA